MDRPYRATAAVCAGTGCVAEGALDIFEALKEEIKKQGIENEVQVTVAGCSGYCMKGPIVSVYPEGIFYHSLTVEDIANLVEEHFIKGRPVEKLMYKEPDKKVALPTISEIPFFKHQVLRVLRNKGLIDPDSIDDYIARDGYQAAARALTQMTQEEIIAEVKASGLRGRGGAGFPTGVKWESCVKAGGEKRFIVCNGDEGDPGAYMDRAIMESDPHAVLEGMLIGARAIDAKEGYIYVRAEYPLAVQRLQNAIRQAREYGLLGKDILESGVDFDIEIYKGAGAFVCGESSALMYSIEGRRPMPRPRPPQSTESGLWELPTVLNNVETFANIPLIILKGAVWFRSLGTEKSTGTKVFAITGAINNVGLVEVPMGMPLRKIVFEIGGDIANKRKFKAVQLGGPSGGCLPESLLDTPVEFEAIAKTGAIMGSGGMVVIDDTNCMVNVAKFFLQFTAHESCGKCPSCRIGTRIMLDMLEDITQGNGSEGDIETLLDLAEDVTYSSLCGLGQSAANPVVTTIRYFRDEYEAHIKDKWCKTGVCRKLVSFQIAEEACKGCGACMRACRQHAILGEKKKPHKIIEEICVQCRACYEACKFNAIKINPSKKLQSVKD
ncbi:MAG TPA: NADH-quinone oxidoreductase subunit NuoF [Thermodesulfovibrionia bacterium]|nr:NADH-quinone oxidoreductase subunit NuoF [Thermodesulfovibrionia bacterium]